MGFRFVYLHLCACCADMGPCTFFLSVPFRKAFRKHLQASLLEISKRSCAAQTLVLSAASSEKQHWVIRTMSSSHDNMCANRHLSVCKTFQISKVLFVAEAWAENDVFLRHASNPPRQPQNTKSVSQKRGVFYQTNPPPFFKSFFGVFGCLGGF